MTIHHLVVEHISDDCSESFMHLHEASKQGLVLGAAMVVMLKRGRYFVDLTGTASRDPNLTRGLVCALDDELSRLIRGDAYHPTRQ